MQQVLTDIMSALTVINRGVRLGTMSNDELGEQLVALHETFGKKLKDQPAPKKVAEKKEESKTDDPK